MLILECQPISFGRNNFESAHNEWNSVNRRLADRVRVLSAHQKKGSSEKKIVNTLCKPELALNSNSGLYVMKNYFCTCNKFSVEVPE